MLPLSNEEMLEALVALNSDESEEVRGAARSTINSLEPAGFITFAQQSAAPPEVLAFLALWPRAPRELVEAVVFNRLTPDSALALLAAKTGDGRILEAISLKQQNLIRSPDIIDAILTNPARTPEADRRVREVQAEFFEKDFGARMVAEEQRVQTVTETERHSAEEAARNTVSIASLEDLIELGLIEEGIDDSIVTDYEAEFGPFEISGPDPDEQMDIGQAVSDAFSEIEHEVQQVLMDRMPVFQQIALMSVKDRVLLAIKGTREARMVLVRDPNKVVAAAVLRNPRLTDSEVESIASIRSVPEDVLRQIGQNRAWTKSYTLIHNLVKNPRTPIAIALGFLNRIQTRDMRALSSNKNIPDVIRQTAYRLYLKRSGTKVS
ncbi:MAG TPA: hypothetical protein VIG62_10105 [Blastocatellia bacterium]|jgi:hypothetical protein